MAALSAPFMGRAKQIGQLKFPVAGGVKCWKGGYAVGDTAQGMVVPATTATALFSLGRFVDTVDNTAGADGDVMVNVDLAHEIWCYWIDNATAGDAVTAADLWKVCYWKDDHTVQITSTGASVAGRIWAVDSKKGVLVEFSLGVQGATGPAGP